MLKLFFRHHWHLVRKLDNHSMVMPRRPYLLVVLLIQRDEHLGRDARRFIFCWLILWFVHSDLSIPIHHMPQNSDKRKLFGQPPLISTVSHHAPVPTFEGGPCLYTRTIAAFDSRCSSLTATSGICARLPWWCPRCHPSVLVYIVESTSSHTRKPSAL